MQLLIFLLFTFLSPVHALDTGTGADGDCGLIFTGISTATTEFNCTDLTVTGVNTFTGITNIIIRVQGDVEIIGTLNLAGNGITAGPGGFNGGAGGAIDGADGGAPAGVLNARGRGGRGSISNGFDPCAAAGGSGGRHSSVDAVSAALNFDNGVNDCDPVIAQGGAAPSASYGNPLDFHTLIRGGAGGGAGGGADDTFITENGANGGGGGGALIIFAGGNMVVRAGAQINLNGSNGSDSTNIAGAGGGGAGGAILASVLGDLELEATSVINVSGGTGGAANGTGTDGTDGGRGFIRLEDGDGAITGADGSTAPGASTGLNPDAAASGSSRSELQLQSDISAGCAIRASDQSSSPWILLAFFTLLLVVIKAKVNKTTSSRMSYQG